MEQVASNCESTEINGLYTRMHINSLSLNNFPAYIFCKKMQLHKCSLKKKKNFKKSSVSSKQTNYKPLQLAESVQASNGIRSDRALIHIYRKKSCTASALPASHHLFQPSSRATHPANKLTEENMTVPESTQFSWHLHLNPRFMRSLICLLELKQLRRRHAPSCYLPCKAQEERQHPGATQPRSSATTLKLVILCIHMRFAF